MDKLLETQTTIPALPLLVVFCSVAPTLAEL
ncbi:hypothetical protein Tco_0614371, partial [Tanacetum coccineum]